ncbi:hypothetical protein Tco_1274007 [Tanacetum coccineum]
MVPLQSDTIRLVQNGCSFHRLRSEDLNQHLKDFLKLMDSLDLDGENRERRRLHLFQFSLRDQASNWLELQIFYDHVDNTIQISIDYAIGGKLRKLRPDKAWAAIERLAQYENEGWNDAFVLEDISPNYENPNIEQLLRIIEHKVDTLMKDAISLVGKSKSVFRLATNEMYRPPSEPLCQEEFEHIVMNFVLDQEERIRQLEDYMQAITDEFMEFSLEAMSKRAISTRGHASSSRDETMEEKVYKYDPLHKGVTFRLRGVEREMPLLEFGWRVSLYSERESRDVATLSSLRNAETVNATYFTHMFWPTIGDGGKPPIVSLKLTYSISIASFGEGVVCNIPYWLAKYLKSMKDKSVIFSGMFVTRISWSFGLLTNELLSVLNREPPPHVYRKTSLIKMGLSWNSTRVRVVSRLLKRLRGRVEVYQARWMDQQDEHWGRIDTWMGQYDERAHWMYDHTVIQFQHMSTRDNLKPHLQIDPFLGFEADYPPYGYQGHMPPRYFAFGGNLEELHVTWAHLEKKWTRLRTYTNISQDNVLSGWRRRHRYNVTPS